MTGRESIRWLAALAGCATLGLGAVLALAPAPGGEANITKLMQDGNFKEAYDLLRPRVLDPDAPAERVPQDFLLAVDCLVQLGRIAEFDPLFEATLQAHGKNWRLLQTAADRLLNMPPQGFIIAGEFQRGRHRGGGRVVNSFERDRVRALQLMVQAMPLVEQDEDRAAAAEFYLTFSRMLLSNRGFGEAWRLGYLSNLAELPHYEDGWWYHGQRSGRGAPVDEEGLPVYHRVPASFAAATTDGERWRWAIVQAAELHPERRDEVRALLADFLHDQFGVQTMAQHGGGFRPLADDGSKDESGPYAVHTLTESETIAKLAGGIKRFELPDEFNFVKIYRDVASNPKSSHAEHALGRLAQIFQNRRQYPRAAEALKQSIAEHGDAPQKGKQQQLDQIIGNWGRFEPIDVRPAGAKAQFDFRFRNARSVAFEAHEINVEKLLGAVKTYLKASPAQLDWSQINVQDLGYRLVQMSQTEYVGRQVARWEVPLEPPADHHDRRITVESPLEKAGAYLVTAKVAGGNTNQIILWVQDTAIVRMPLDQAHLFFVADAVTGKPITGADIELFGYRQVSDGPRRYRVVTVENKAATDVAGQAILGSDSMPANHQWLVTARTKDGRMAYHGFDHIWYGRHSQGQYDGVKAFTITDRPVYRPNQSVKFKTWIARTRYDAPDESRYANLSCFVEILNPRGEAVLSKQYTTDAFGGLDDELALPADAGLGVYQLVLYANASKQNALGSAHFRVEEYKKPEFEVAVEAPSEPVKLGDKVTAKIRAKYYFGAPVTQATVKYTVTRTTHRQQWYPPGRWDWFYGTGYWWFAYDYAWYPGWAEWGCARPLPWWYDRGYEQPEIVAQNEVPIGPDGTVEVEIDTGPAAAIHPDRDHKYEISAEVVDRSRRTIVGSGNVLVARKPFKVFAWVDRGYYRTGNVIEAGFAAQTLDQKPVEGKGVLELRRITYVAAEVARGGKVEPKEEVVERWELDTNDQGRATQKIKAAAPGQYRLAYTLTDAKGNAIEGAYVINVLGPGLEAEQFAFNDLELLPEKREYAPGDSLRLMVNTRRADSTVLLFIRPSSGVYLPPKVLTLSGKSSVQTIEVGRADMPNFFVEAVTISGGKVFSETREIVVPPEDRVVNVEVLPSAAEYRPGEEAKVRLKLTDPTGEPINGSTVVSIYDKSVEYIAGGSNVPEIKAFFWKWRRHHQPQFATTLARWSHTLAPRNEQQHSMQDLGVFGDQIVEGFDLLAQGDEVASAPGDAEGGGLNFAGRANRQSGALARGAARPQSASADEDRKRSEADKGEGPGAPPGQDELQQPTVRSAFADTAYWSANVTVKDGLAEITLKMPENLTTWKVRTWTMAAGTRVGEGSAEVVTRKNLIVRMQAPRFFVEKDEVVLSANVHNYLEQAKTVRVELKLEGDYLVPLDPVSRTVEIASGGEARVDWRVRVAREGAAVVQMAALADEESDAMQMTLPVFVHGILKTDSWTGSVRPEEQTASFTIAVPAERRPDQSRLEIRYSPSLAGAMVDALPYLVDYPYGCTEQTLNRFLPTVITQRILLDMKIDLAAVAEKRTNLNAQEIGDDRERARGWKRFDRNPVFDIDEVKHITAAGVARLAEMQLGDGGWGWFSGYGEQSTPHTTAVVVHGLQVAKACDVALPAGMLEGGVAWLRRYQEEQLLRLSNAVTQTRPYKTQADNLDALVYMILVDAGAPSDAMRDHLYRDRVSLAVYAKAMLGLALEKQGEREKLAMVLRNIEQFVVEDDENQTAHLRLPADIWWHWYGSENEAHAYYLKLLARTDPKGRLAPKLVKYLLNNRKHSTYWNSTRDTALCIEALADYLRASGEASPDMTVEIRLGDRVLKAERITAQNLFTFDNKLVLEGEELTSGKHTIEVRRQGRGPVYFNAYLTNFSLEDPIPSAGLEVKVQRKYYKLVPVDKRVKAEGARGQAVDQRVEKYDRVLLEDGAMLTSGELVEIELEIESKNDYEYLIFEDMKAAGFEPVELRSGYGGTQGLHAYMELRDERVSLFVARLARGKHSVAYRMRAEIPGRFSALPTRAWGMYAPELAANSGEQKVRIEDRP